MFIGRLSLSIVFVVVVSHYLQFNQKGITAATRVCWSIISLTQIPYPLTLGRTAAAAPSCGVVQVRLEFVSSVVVSGSDFFVSSGFFRFFLVLVVLVEVEVFLPAVLPS